MNGRQKHDGAVERENHEIWQITAGEACIGVSQYTLRYRYVTGSGLRPDTPKGRCVARNTLA